MIRFSYAHTAAVLLMSGCAVAAIMLSGTLGPIASAAIPTLFVLASLNALRDQPIFAMPTQAGAFLSVALVLYSGSSLRSQKDISEVASTFAGSLVVLRILTRDSARSDIQLAVLSLFAFLSVALLTPSVDYGAFLLLYVIIAPVALALTHLRGAVERNERSGAKDKAGVRVDLGRILRSKRVLNHHFLGLAVLLIAPIVLGTLFVFFLFPRVGLAAVQLQLNNNRARIGFASDVVLGNTATPEQDSTVALRLKPPEQSNSAPYLGAYMRGAVATIDNIDGLRSEAPPELPSTSDARCIKDLAHDRVLEDLPLWTVDSLAPDQTYLFLPLGHVRVTLQKPVNGCVAERNATHEISATPSSAGSRYVYAGDTLANTHKETLSTDGRAKLLRVQESTRRTLDAVRADFPNASSDRATASAIEQQFRTRYSYDLASSSRQATEPLADFLANTHRGHCEFFAAAMTLLLRDRGIPARVVTGYFGGDYNKYGAFYTFRQSDAHAWVEAYLDSEQQWVRFDPTPNAAGAAGVPSNPSAFREFYDASSALWQRYFVSYDLHRQQDLVDRVGQAAGATAQSSLLAKVRALTSKQVAVAIGVLVAAAALARRRGGMPVFGKAHRQSARLAAQASALERTLARQGHTRASQETISVFARRVAANHTAAESLQHYATSYNELRYGNAELTRQRKADLTLWLSKIGDAT